MDKLSVLIFAKDENEVLKKTLAAVKNGGFADELVMIIDKNGYGKATVKLAKEYQSKIHFRSLDNFRDHKNFGITQTKNCWVLLLDADEEVSPELSAAIHRLLQSGKIADYAAYNIAFKTMFFGHWLRYSVGYPDYHLRLFDKTKCCYQYLVHEILQVKGQVGTIKSGDIIHYSFRNWRQWQKKIEIYADLDARERVANSRRFSLIYLFGKPLKEFCWRYFKQEGWKDSQTGLLFALMMAYYRFLTAIKIRKMNKQDENCH